MSLPPLIALAHGSRDPEAAAAVAELASAVGGLRTGLRVVPAFLDLSEPDLTDACRELSEPSAVVVPLLFSAAFHAGIDVPQAVTGAMAVTGRRLITSEILGLGPQVLQALQSRADELGVASRQDILLLAVGSSDTQANAAVIELADRWAGERGSRVRAAFATCAPRAVEMLGEAHRPAAVVPLFVGPGLLLTAVRRRAAEVGVAVAEPLGTELAQLVLDRYDEALAAVRE